MIVTFINEQLGYESSGTLLQGFSGKTYAQSRWNNAFTAQVCIWNGTQMEYAAMIRDVSRAWHQAMRRWIPMAFEQDAPLILPAEVQEFLAGYNLAMDGMELPDAASVAAELGHTLVKNRVALVEKITEPISEPVDPAKTQEIITETLKEPASLIAHEPALSSGTALQQLTAENIIPLKHFAKTKIARSIGINPDDYKGDVPGLVQAILSKATEATPA